ncbi:MAG: phage tail tape measure protein [Clostridium sp.]|nr:phage tail tape measure protein [Clostridium sp.]
MNENDFLIELQAILDSEKSKGNISKSLDRIQNQLDKLKIQAEIDPKTIQDLTKQLEKVINQKITISNIGLDANAAVKSAQQTGQQIGNAINQGASQGLKNSSKILENFKKSLANIGMGSNEIDAVANKIENLGIQIESLNQSVSNTSKRNILSVDISGTDELGQIIKLTEQYDISTGDLIKNIEAVSSAQQRAGAATDTFIDKQKKAVASAKNALSTIESKLNDTHSTKSLANTDFDSNGLNAQLDKVRTAISNLDSASRDTFTQAQIDVETETTALNNLITALKNAEYAATSLRTKDVETIKIDEGNKLDAFVQKMEQSGHYTDELKQKVSDLRTTLSNVFKGDQNGLTNFLNGFSNLKTEFQKVDATAKTLEKSTKLQTNIEAEKKILQVYTNELKEAGVLTDDVKEKIQNMFYSLSKVDSQNGLVTWRAELKGVKAETDAVLKSVTQLSQKKLSDIQSSIDNGYGASKYQNQIDKTIATLKQYEAEAQVIEKINNDLQSSFDKMKGLSGQELNAQADIFEEKIKAAKVSIDEAKLSYDKLMQPASKESITTTLLRVQTLLNNNTRATGDIKAEWQSYVNRLSSGSNIAEKEIRDINLRLKETKSTLQGLGKLGLSWTDKLKQTFGKLSNWGIVTSSMITFVNQLQKIPEEVVKVDSAMIELNKVSDATASDIKNYFDEAAESAKEYGSSVSDMINATADWIRLGYNLPDSKKLAEIATLYKNVGDGIDISTANESLVSTLQGFQLNAEDALGIIDRFNEVANNFPIDSAGIGEALQRSAASFYAANTDLSKSIALITGTNSVVQDPSRVGNMWKTVSMRIRGAVQELEDAGLETDGMVESTATLRKLVKGLTGFDIMADEAGTQFKDIYDIVVGIGKEWKNLTDVEQAGLLETLAGKMQGNALSAALNNISMIEDAYKTAENSAGSALREQETYEQGIQYSFDRLKASFQAFANHILDSDLLKGIVDFGNGTINVLDAVTDKLGSLGTIGLGAGIFTGVKNLGKGRKCVPFNCFEYALLSQEMKCAFQG